MLLGFWKLILSFTLGGYSLEMAIRMRRSRKILPITDSIMMGSHNKGGVWWWLILHELGSIIGLVATIAITAKEWSVPANTRPG